MLVLTRKSNQSVMIRDDIEVTVLSIIGEKVRIGIQAPPGDPRVPQGGLPGDPAGERRRESLGAGRGGRCAEAALSKPMIVKPPFRRGDRRSAGEYLAFVVAVVAQDAELGPDQRQPTWHAGAAAAVTLAARSGSPRQPLA